jgi:hypothetical protein
VTTPYLGDVEFTDTVAPVCQSLSLWIQDEIRGRSCYVEGIHGPGLGSGDWSRMNLSMGGSCSERIKH